ncbi:MAG: STAS domain-containing protein [Candidatus Kapabacteria bacterium]|nr:STAS domain-containing protein [Candidatus Kapabacteria bacterium]
MLSQIKVEEQIGGKIIHLRGKFTGGEETSELNSILKELAKVEKSRVIINMEKVSYLNSTALGVLISAHASFARNGGTVVLAGLGDSIQNLFMVTKLVLVFPIYKNLDEAIKSISE